MLANRLPYSRSTENGQTVWTPSPGGLVSALTPILRTSGGSWIGWDGNVGRPPAPFEQDGIRCVPIALSQRDVDGFYTGFSNRALWPLYHDAVARPRFEPRWWQPYVDVNRRFAELAASEAAPGAKVLVQDYHLQLAPAMLRQLRPDVRIGFFLHIPFPPQELFAQLPWRKPLLEGLLGSDFFACHTEIGAANFAQLAIRYAGAEAVEGQNALRFEGRTVRYGALPISIDVNRFETLARSEAAHRRAEEIRRELGNRRILLGVDRLDYTKGIDIRLRAFATLLDRGVLSPEECVMVQTAVPSRGDVLEYVRVRDKVEQMVGSINGRHGSIGRVAVHYLHQNLAFDDLVPLYMAADVMLVTPLRDGMNLVCKEYVASRVDEGGVLVLSEFTGAAHELREALLVNPYDNAAVSNAIVQALEMPPGEVRRRMKALRRRVEARDVYRWAADFLGAIGD